MTKNQTIAVHEMLLKRYNAGQTAFATPSLTTEELIKLRESGINNGRIVGMILARMMLLGGYPVTKHRHWKTRSYVWTLNPGIVAYDLAVLDQRIKFGAEGAATGPFSSVTLAQLSKVIERQYDLERGVQECKREIEVMISLLHQGYT